jgi:hypothetical protein
LAKLHASISVIGLGGRKSCRNNELLFLLLGRVSLAVFISFLDFNKVSFLTFGIIASILDAWSIPANAKEHGPRVLAIYGTFEESVARNS